MTRPFALALLLAGAACGPRVTGPPPAPCHADAAPADAPGDAGAFDFACWSDGALHCFVGPDARAACLADPARGGAPCE